MRIVTSAAAGRPVYYDRNPAIRWALYNVDTVAPHVDTTRAAYTVPAGKKAYAEATFAQVIRAAAAAAAARAYAAIRYTPSGGTIAQFVRVLISTNGVGDKDSMQGGSFSFLATGDLVELAPGDGSTGGTVDYRLTLKATE